MLAIETYYLVDFENVHEDGLSGSEHLGSHDHVHLFSTKNAPKISIEKLTHLNSTNLFTHEIPTGNQSLDMHLVSYLGYLIGANNSDCKYIIISQDTDYDNIISFWKDYNNSHITRQNQIEISKSNVSSKTTGSANSIGAANIKPKTITIPQTKCQLNTEVQLALSKAKYNKAAINKTASIVVKHYGESQFASNVHNELKDNYTNYSDIYQVVKPIISRYSSTATQGVNTTTELNSAIQKLLSKAGFTSDVINHVASLVSRNYKEENGKQYVYRSIIAEYGQTQGLNIYNHVKKHF